MLWSEELVHIYERNLVCHVVVSCFAICVAIHHQTPKVPGPQIPDPQTLRQ